MRKVKSRLSEVAEMNKKDTRLLPSWKDENPVQYEKQQINTRLTKLRRMPGADPAEIRVLEERYAVLDEPQREKRKKAAAQYFKKFDRAPE
jgi:hypothetical protein